MLKHIDPYQPLANNSDSTSGGRIYFAISTLKGKIAKKAGAFYQAAGRTPTSGEIVKEATINGKELSILLCGKTCKHGVRALRALP